MSDGHTCSCGDTKTLLLDAMQGAETRPCSVHRPAREAAPGDPLALNSDELVATLTEPNNTL